MKITRREWAAASAATLGLGKFQLENLRKPLRTMKSTHQNFRLNY